MKIGILARTLMMAEKYWDKLQDKADCWWGVTQQELYDALIQKGHTKIVFHPEKSVKDMTKKRGNQFVAIDPGKAENLVAQDINPDLWITESLNKLNYVPKKTFWVQTFHSMPIKRHFFYPPVLEYDLMLVPGEYHKQELIRRLDMDPKDERLKVVGWPRIDDFFNGVFDREQIMNDLGLDSSRKTIMYAPTWGWGYGNDAFFARWMGREAEIFEQVCRKAKDMNVNLIVKLHSLSFNATNKKMIDIAKQYGVLWLTKETSGYQDDPNALLWITDVLMSDLSGIIADYVSLDRPIIYIDPDEKLDAWESSDMPRDFRVGSVVRDPAELIKTMESSIRTPGVYSHQRKELAAKLFYKPDGKAIDRAVDEILKFSDVKLSKRI